MTAIEEGALRRNLETFIDMTYKVVLKHAPKCMHPGCSQFAFWRDKREGPVPRDTLQCDVHKKSLLSKEIEGSTELRFVLDYVRMNDGVALRYR